MLSIQIETLFYRCRCCRRSACWSRSRIWRHIWRGRHVRRMGHHEQIQQRRNTGDRGDPNHIVGGLKDFDHLTKLRGVYVVHLQGVHIQHHAGMQCHLHTSIEQQSAQSCTKLVIQFQDTTSLESPILRPKLEVGLDHQVIWDQGGTHQPTCTP
jgi:hypothetical protein